MYPKVSWQSNLLISKAAGPCGQRQAMWAYVTLYSTCIGLEVGLARPKGVLYLWSLLRCDRWGEGWAGKGEGG